MMTIHTNTQRVCACVVWFCCSKLCVCVTGQMCTCIHVCVQQVLAVCLLLFVNVEICDVCLCLIATGLAIRPHMYLCGWCCNRNTLMFFVDVLTMGT